MYALLITLGLFALVLLLTRAKVPLAVAVLVAAAAAGPLLGLNAAQSARHLLGGALQPTTLALVVLMILLLVLCIMVFRHMLGVTGAAPRIARELTALRVPVELVVMVLPFIAGLVTGLAVGFVGTSFPIVIALVAAMPGDVPLHPYVALAYAFGHLGQMLSPLHVCHVMSNRYFNTGFGPVYRQILPAAGLTAALAMTYFLILRGSPLRFGSVYTSRSAAGRDEALQKFADRFGLHTELAVTRGLRWLGDHQYHDGSWGPEYRVAMTGLALLAFLAHGETTSSVEYGVTVKSGLQYLLRRQERGIFHGGGWHDERTLFRDQIMAYEHAIGTYAVAEAYTLTHIPMLRGAMEDAVQVIIDGQHGAGAWDYGYARGPEAHSDTSLAGWHVQAIKAAMVAEAGNRGLTTALESAIEGLRGHASPTAAGMFSYGTRDTERPPDMAMSAVAVLCMQLSGHALDPEARYGMGALRKLPFAWSGRNGGTADERRAGRWPFYAWYYMGQARFHQGGMAWRTWNRSFAPTLCAMQNPDGSWGPAPDSVEAQFGPVYHTALGTLMLEVYYRILPTYQEIEVAHEPMDWGQPDDFIIRMPPRHPTG